MCGIWAIFGSNVFASKLSATYMKISHRGPDAFRIENVKEFPSCCLGFHWLPIMDTLHGIQPMRLHSLPHLWLCYNGEIYNHKLIQREFAYSQETESDGEAILQMYDRKGMKFTLQHLDGVFAFVLLDVAKQKVFLARDTYGVKPAFKLFNKEGLLAVSSEAKGLTNLVHSNSDVAVSPLTPGYFETYELSTLGEAIFKAREIFQSVGQAPIYKTMIVTYGDDVSANIRTLLGEAVKKRLMSKRRIGCMLSGGLDSSLIAALAAQHAKEMGLPYCMQTFTVGMEGSPDIIAARKVAKHIQSEHHEVIFTLQEGIEILRDVIYHLECCDVITVRGGIAMYLLSKYISTETDTVVVFLGEGADELCQGYKHFFEVPTARKSHIDSVQMLTDLYLYDNLRADRTTAAHGLELRVPMQDHQFTSYYLNLPAESRVPKDGIEKYLMRKAFDGTNIIPDDILWRRKNGFSEAIASTKRSFSSSLQEHAANLVSDSLLGQAKELFPINPPVNKEAFLYRQIFEELFPGCTNLVSYDWAVEWTINPSTDILSPSELEGTYL